MALITDHSYDPTIGNTYSVRGRWTPLNGTAPIALYHHGSNQDGWQPIAGTFATPEGTGPGQATLIRALAEAGYFLCSSDFGGSLWGNANDHTFQLGVMNYACLSAGYTALGGGSGVLATYTYLNRYISTGKKVFLCGTSMGGLSAMSMAARYPTIVGAVAGFEPTVDQNFNKITFAACDTSYGGNYNDTTYGSDHNPTYQATQGKFNTLPTRLWYGSADIYARPTEITAFVTNVATAGGPASSMAPASTFGVDEILPTGQTHSEDAIGLVPVDTLLNFARRFCPIT